MRRPLSLLICILIALDGVAQDSVLHFVFTSDVHYGITRKEFRGGEKVPSYIVNRAMIGAINRLPGGRLPRDGGAGAGQKIVHLDGLLITGDIANREEKGVQSDAASWKQFEAAYDHLLTITDRHGKSTPIYLSPGNHDVSNAVGFWRPAKPLTDATSMAGIYNRMMKPARPRTAATYNYATDKIHCIRDIAGIRLVFLDVWPDSTDQAWMDAHLQGPAPTLLFTHSNPDVEARFFTNPNDGHGIDSTDKFENLLPEVFKDGHSVKDSAVIEQRAFAAFLKRHPEIKAYFHGHNNYTEFYRWQGTPCFRVDSPMKGKFSSKDEKQLAFELITIDTRTRTMTVRECLWNTKPKDPKILVWGESKTITL
ncbi:MAG TPA: metallophosphoesterase [Dinghuibacter sp.]|uniref:metallophosphoesterase n=1 Tax=Dinghuibacter sp. TaxID=2024697 RepID=UPI002B7B59D2|nr:metallophosphoesterase [Dinghuibacter sp.]HTJ11872.1 metallophosphoesterase [Dinghuibacter sp.]